MGKFFWIVVIFLVIGAYIIKTGYDIDFRKAEDRKTFFVSLWKWIIHLGKNIFELTGKAVQQEWLPVVNATNQTEGKVYYIVGEGR